MKQSIRSLSRLWLWVLALLVAQQTQAQLLTEDFPNSGTLTAVSSWTQTGSSATNPIIAGQPNLTYAGLSTSGNAAILTTTGQDVSRAYTAQTSGTVYASCLVNVTSAQATGDYFFHLASSTGGTLFYDRLFVKSVTGGIQFGIAKNSNTPAYAPTIYTLNTTYFIVIKYTYNPGTGDDVASFFINPVLGGSEPTSAATDAAGTDASSSAGIGAINLRQGTATNAPNVVVDYIRVGTNWTDVTQAPAPVATLSVNPTTLSGFSTTQGTPSATQTYALTGSTLSADVTVTAPVGYEISQDGTNFQNTITVIRSNGSVNATITVRLTGASAGSPSGAITNGSGSVSANVTVSGTVSAPNSPSLSVSPTTLAGFSTTQGTASAIQTYALSGSNLTSDVTVTAPAGYQVSLDGTTFQNTVTATQTNGAVNATVSVQLAGTSAGIFSGSITNASAGVATVSVPVSGTVGSNSPYTPIVLARSSVGQTVTIAGRVTATNQLGSRQIYIQDNAGGIVVYSGSTGTDLSTLVQLGDSVQARGPITVFNGFTEITSAATTNFTIVSGAGTRVPTPIAITPDQLPNYQGQLVSIANASITPVASTFTGGTNYTITANGQSATLRISANSPLAGAGQPANPVSVTGIADRFVSGATSTGTNGLQLQPRILADIPGSTPAQDLTCTAGMSNSTLGTEQTLDIATWNMEFFGADAGTIICPNGNLNYNDMGPTNEDLQQSNAVTVLSKLKADIVGVEEVSDLNRLAATVASLPGSYSYTCSDRFSYYFQDECTQTPSGNPPTVFGPNSLAQKVCVIYNRATVTPVLAETKPLLTDKYSYPSANNWSSGRLPFLFVGDVTINGVTQRVHVVTIHAKSGSATSDYNRRKQDIIDLKANLDATYPNAKLIILGDYNDKLNGSIASGQQSSYKPFVDDASNYSALTLPLENNGCSTFNSSASFIDHMIISNDLAPAAISNSTYVLQPFSIPNYGNTTSDHNPVVTRFDLTKLTTPVTALTVTATATPTQFLTSGSTTITASVSGGTAPYSYIFTGPGTITANGNTATVSSLSAGVQTFTVTATDATTPTAQTSFTTVSVTVTQGNRPPVAISSLLSGTVTVGQSFSVDARTLFTDPDGDSLLITVAVLPAGFTFNNNILSGRFTQAGQYGVDILVYDASSVGYGRFTLTVTANTAPVVANAIAPQSATVGSAYTLSLAGVFTDAETPSQLGLSVSGLPAGLSFTAPSTISGTPLASGVNTVTVTATDPGSLSASTTFTLTASPTSSAPMILVSQSSLNEFRYTTQSQGSGAQSYTVSATGLSQSLTVVAPSAYFVSIDNYTFDQQVVLPAPGGVVSPKRIYVILGTGTAGTYNGVVKNTSGGVTSTVAVDGTVLQATLSAQPTALNNLTTIAGTPSTVQTYTVTTLNQTGISVVAPVGVEIRTGNRPFSTSLTIGYSYSTVSVPVDVRLTGANAGPITGTITHKSAYGQADLVASVTINGFVSTPGTPTEPFSITGVTLGSCTTLSVGERQISFSPQYAGLTGESISFRVANESVPTTAAGPYSLKLYTDNPVISLRAMQGSGSEVSYAYNWLAACNNTTPVNPTNTAPVVANAIAPQSATAGSAYTLSLAGVFTDSETPNQLSLSATGLPAGLSLNGTSISGTPSTTVGSPYTVTVTATDPGSLSTSTSFVLTVSPAATTTPGNPTVPFSITGVTLVSCTTLSVGERQISFSPQYAGVTGEAISFRVANESTPTTAAGPYSLKLYTDNPVISLRAVQGSGSEVSYAYNWLAACNTTTPVNPTNTAPVVANAIAPQSATVGSAYTLSLAGVFTDAETPNQLTLSASGLPAGLSLSGTSISGTPSTTVGSPYTVSVTATDPGNLSASTSFVLTVGASSGVNPTVPFSITGVTLVSCSADGVGARRISFNPQYAGVTGEVISFRVVNESEPTTAAGPYSLRLYTDNPVINLRAMQGNGSEVSYAYNWLAACTANGRIRAQEQAESLTVTVLGNPVVGETVNVEIRGAGGQSVRVLAVDGRGHTVSDSRIEQATGVEKASVRLGRTPGIYLLQISTASQQQTVKLIRE